MTSAQARIAGGNPRVDRGVPIVDGPCACHECGRKFKSAQDGAQHRGRIHVRPVADLRKIIPIAPLDGHAWAHQRNAAEREAHRKNTKWVGDRGRKLRRRRA